MKVATVAQTRRLEQLAVEAGASWESLMLRAGGGMARVAREMLENIRPARALVLVGPGNNGGDGLVIARRLHESGVGVAIYTWRRSARPEDWPLREARERQISELDAASDPNGARLRRLLVEADLVVDALLGIGVTRPLDADLCRIVDIVNTSERPILAVDVPTGVDADTGAVLGCAIRATATAVAGVMKPGLLYGRGATLAGVTHLVPIGLPDDLENEHMAETMTARDMGDILPARPVDSNKGTFGKVMIIAGSGRYPGAAYLAARGALRSGAGLVTLAVGRSLYGALAASVHEATFLPLPEEEWGVLGGAAATEILGEMRDYRAIVLGPGLGREDETKTFVQRFLALEMAKAASGVGFLRATPAGDRERRPGGGVGFVRAAAPHQPASQPEEAHAEQAHSFVLDADALNLLAEVDGWNERLAAISAVLTPHPGEMARLLKLGGPDEVNADRVGTAQRAAEIWKQVVVLKGAGTVVAAPDGRTALGPGGNPALATAGTGDVLAGLIGGLIAQGLDLFDAARLGVYLHAAAGTLVLDAFGEAGAVAGDLLDHLPRAMRALRSEA